MQLWCSLRDYNLSNSTYEPRHEISNNVVCVTSKASDQPAHTRSLIRAFASRLNILSLKGGCTGASLSLHFSKCHIVGNHMSRLMFYSQETHYKVPHIALGESRHSLNHFSSTVKER